MKKRICFVVQRYGLEVNGGAELLCRQFAEIMAADYDVSVFTTKAIDYVTWKNEYKNDSETINGVKVYRFPVEITRDIDEFTKINMLFDDGMLKTIDDEDNWFKAQGPYSPALIEALKEHVNDYDAFIFNTYLYYTSVYGIPAVKEKAIFIPDAHDEPFLRFERVKEEFLAPKAIFFNTEDERQLIHSRFHNEHIPSDIGGVGIEIPDGTDAEAFRKKFNIYDDFIIYVGRIDEGKNCGEMFRFWQTYKRENPSKLKLVLMGKPALELPRRDDVISLGFVTDEEKLNGIAACRFLWLPSKFESLSMVVLEAMSLSKPVLVNGECSVLKTHCTKSNAGLYYESYGQFSLAASLLLTNDEIYRSMSANGPGYVEQNYQWNIIIGRLAKLIDNI